MKNRLIVLVSITSVLVVMMTLYLLSSNEAARDQRLNSEVGRSTKDRDESVQKLNDYLYKQELRRREKLKNATQKDQEKEKSYWNNIISIERAAIKNIHFYGKIIDQHGDPVPHVVVECFGLNGALSAGSGLQRVVSNSDGIFEAKASGTGFYVENFKKLGYDFPPRKKFVNIRGVNKSELLWSDYTQNNPYIFKAWKVADTGYPETSHSNALYGFKPGVRYSMDFTNSNKSRVKKEGSYNLDLQVLFTRNGSNWSLTLDVPDGGLVESTDLYMNKAPEIGYAPQVYFEGVVNNPAIRKKYYIHSRGKLYGRLDLEIIPYYRDKSAILTTYIMNLDGGRHLEVKGEN